ncbi:MULTISPECIES: GPW/gp25 family protein [Methylococcus]|uniref:Putative prophage MuMc02, baseplate assembly protein W n=1 Tax=Methylococcus capsulatus (strain ATCC 33009 / NCIMB 11132 / Bath) TaxID=243233 RepID=Q602Z9_METCA|nr:GPW/gp25 family protein [Methylococcus capsulatus]AAU91008.1 putative prophage MuMc02, baseplate assembly protein W [Methylococcus capsulatus str. Bath]
MTSVIGTIASVNWQPRLGQPGDIVQDAADIDQAIRIILTTPKGSDPHRPEFGADILQYVDRPEIEATPYLIAEIADAILLWEPRIELISIRPSFGLAQVTLAITWRFRGVDSKSSGGDSQTRTTEVTL